MDLVLSKIADYSNIKDLKKLHDLGLVDDIYIVNHRMLDLSKIIKFRFKITINDSLNLKIDHSHLLLSIEYNNQFIFNQLISIINFKEYDQTAGYNRYGNYYAKYEYPLDIALSVAIKFKQKNIKKNYMITQIF